MRLVIAEGGIRPQISQIFQKSVPTEASGSAPEHKLVVGCS